MRAMVVGAQQNLVLAQVEKPEPKAGEILIAVYAAALNRADLLQRKGTYPSPAGWPQWPGLEVAGVVAAMGAEAEKCSEFQVGDKVCALLGGGGYGEFVCAPWGMVMPIPKGLTFAEAASLPEAYATSYLNLFYEGHLQAGQTAFIPAGTSGLASAAIPLAKAFGARVITTVRSDESAEKIKNLGADVIINSKKQDVDKVLQAEAENGHPVNVAMDCVAGDMLGKSLQYMAEGGYWIVISTLAGVETNVLLRPLLTKGLHLVGSMLRKRPSEEKAALLRELVEKVWPKLESGEIKPSIYQILPFADAMAAHNILENNQNIGKVVLQVKE